MTPESIVAFVTNSWDGLAYLIVASVAGYCALEGTYGRRERLLEISLVLAAFLVGRAVLLVGGWL